MPTFDELLVPFEGPTDAEKRALAISLNVLESLMRAPEKLLPSYGKWFPLFPTTNVVVNELGGDYDIRIESDGGTHMFFIDAGNNEILIDPSSTATTADGTLHVHTSSAGSIDANASMNDLVLERATTGGMSILTANDQNSYIAFGDEDDSYIGGFVYQHASDLLSVFSGNNYVMQFTGSTVTVNEDGDDVDFRVETSGNANMLVVDGGADVIAIGGGVDAESTLKIYGQELIVHTATSTDEHALEIDVDAAGYGDIKAIDINYITGTLAAGEDEGVILINIDETQATGGDIFALEVLATDGDAGIYGLKAGALVGPIHQDSGTFANPTTATDNTIGTSVTDTSIGFTQTPDTITDSNNGFGSFVVGEIIVVTGATTGANNTTYTITAATAGALTVTPQPNTVENDGATITVKGNVPAMMDDDTGTTTAIFEADNEYIIIGAAAAFQEMELVLTTQSSKNIKPTFWYSTAGTGQFTQFTPVDGTDGCLHTGVIAWDASDLTAGHVADNGTGTFDIKIIRTRNTIVGNTPVLGYAKSAATTEYIWDKDGDLSIRNISADGDLNFQGAQSITTTAGALTLNPATDVITADDLKLYSGADLIIYSDAGSTEVGRFDGSAGTLTSSSTITAGNTITVERSFTGSFAGWTFKNLKDPAQVNDEFQINMRIEDSNSNSVAAGAMLFRVQDATAASVDMDYNLNLHVAGTSRSMIKAGGSEIVVNNDSIDINFRVETDGSENALFVDGGTNNVGIGTATPSVACTVIGDVQASGLTGWNLANETWTYASATTFTVPTDLTAKYHKGTKIKLTQTTAKYFYVVASSYGAPNTTVTVAAGTDYTLANAAITSPFFSYASNPQGFPSWFTWQPTWSLEGGTLTTTYTTRTGEFTVLGKVAIANFTLTTNVVSVATANKRFVVDLPITAATSGQYQATGDAVYLDIGTEIMTLTAIMFTTTQLRFAAGLAGIVDYYGTSPAKTIANSDQLGGTIVYDI